MTIIDSIFDLARGVIQETIEDKRASKGKWKKESGLAKGTIAGILSGKDSHEHTKVSAINAAFADDNDLLLALVRKMTKTDRKEQAALADYLGRSRYVRKNSAGEIVSGDIEITESMGQFRFQSIPDVLPGQKANDGRKAVHTGPVVRFGDRLILLGIGARYVRVVISHNQDTPQSSVSRAIVLTTDQAHSDPMAGVVFHAHQSFSDLSSFEEDYRGNFDSYVNNADRRPFPGLIIV